MNRCGRKFGFKLTVQQKQHQRDIRVGKSIIELGHKQECQCFICRAKRKEPHKETCKCVSCMPIKNSGMSGKHHTATSNNKNRVSHLGKKYSSETVIKRIESRKQAAILRGYYHSPRSCEQRRKTLMGHPVSKEAKLKNSEAHIGDKHPRWLGGISFIPYPINFNEKLKRYIRERDSYICQLCRASQENLNKKLCVHHIDYDKNNISSNNLLSLCPSCHGKVNSNREYWTNYFIMQYILAA